MSIFLKMYNLKKSVAIVGSASYLQGTGWGSKIDNHDIVVRINGNDLVKKYHSKDIGNRTDVVYMCRSLAGRGKYKKYKWSDGVKFEVLKVDIPLSRDFKKGYCSNTGLNAVVDYAMRGYKVYVYGMDFYAGINNGVIPDSYLVLNGLTVKEELIYLSKYIYELYGDDTGYATIGHIGGKKDAILMKSYANIYPIIFDPIMQTYIDGVD